MKCFADVRVSAYILGSGPPRLTVEVVHGSYPSSRELARIQERMGLWERALIEGGIDIGIYEDIRAVVGTEVILFIGPSVDTTVEAWKVSDTWNIERREDGTVIAVHPFRDYFDLEEHQAAVEMELPAFAQAVTEAHEVRVAEHGGRIAPEEADDVELPMLVTDANQLRQFFAAVAAYNDIDVPPVQPPPACGLAVPDQANNPGLMRDCTALLAAKDTLSGSAALNWSSDTAITGWDGVTTGGTPSRVTKLLLPSKSLSGSIPGELGGLSGLTHLDLSSNSLKGEIPWELGMLSNLTDIRLSGNSLISCIPPALKDVTTNDLSSLNLLYCLPAPGGLTAGTAGETSIPLSWTAVSNGTRYRVEYRNDFQKRWTLEDEAVTGTIHTVDGLHCRREFQWGRNRGRSAYEFRVRVYGDGTTYAAEWSAPSALVKGATGQCVSPVFDEDSYAFSVGEDAGIGTEVGVVSTADPQGETVTYSITGGNEDGKFTIDNETGKITLAAVLDHETTAEYTLTVEAGDGSGGVAAVTVTVTVTDVAEAPSFDEASYSFEVAEDAVVGDAVGTVSATDPDEDDTVSYAITVGNADGKFNIGDGTGAITVASALDHETADSYTLTAQAADGSGGVAAVTVTVTVTDVAEAPVFDEPSYAFEVAEDAAVGNTVGAVSATDPDDGGTLSYAITAGNADGKFAIDVGTGAITVAGVLDRETTAEYTLTVEADDGSGGVAAVTVTVTVTDIAEAPSFDEARYTFEVAEDAATASSVGTVSATDPDAGDTLTYSITSGNAGSNFSIGSSTGEVTVAGTLDPDVLAFYVLTIEARDGSGGTATATVEVTLILSDCSNGTVVPRPNQNPKLVRDCSLLLAAKDTLAGTASLNWGANLAMTRWQGVTLDSVPSLYVRDLILTDLSLTGSIPATLGGLADLQRLDLDENALTGNIPSELGRLRNLRHLYLFGNRLTGGIPHEIGDLGDLEFLYLYDNQLTGGIPSELARLSELRMLLLDNNRLTGGIPSVLGGMDSLEQLYLRDNLLTGEIPSELEGLSNLEHVYLEGNGFTGCIPSGLQDVESNDLNLLELTYCATSGSS